ncbi:DnaJ domain-containing protein [Corallococcus sp. BB11-1]|uniref:DnaJ domain-containing protein n=1 Tax=Corallococcus sp. BB11-1 TaxID=2996783 RepID=UPI002270F3E9|nr:DnaJ domain-containing protein [Corallococcus sp. BB11-1]MCY1036259.1 DnaJ domain-containing protein [Corallococcus sp. BB11-1]
MAEGEVRQYWVRNDRGTTWGPLTAPTIELLIDSGAIQGRIQVSNDGLQFAFPWRFPEVRDVFPRELWGDGAPASLVQSAPIAPPPPPGPVAQSPVAGPVAAPMAGPGAMNAPRAGPPPTAGPGAMRGPAPSVRAGVDAAGRPIATHAAGPGAPPRPGAPAGVPSAAARPAAPPQPAPPQDDGSNTVPPQGQLQQCSPVQLYGRIAAGEHTGLLTLGLVDRTLWIHFRKGNPEFVDSSHAEDGLGVSLLAARLLTADQLQQAEGSRERFGGELLSALFGLGILQPATAFTQLAQRGLGLLGKALRAESGTFTFEARDLPSQKAMPLGNRWAVLSDQVRRIPTADLKRRLAHVLPMPIMKSGGRVAASELRLTPHEVRALAFIDGVRSLGQLLQDVPQDAEHLLRIAFLLKELNGVSFAAVTRTQTAPPPPAATGPTPAAARPAGPVPPQGAAPGGAPAAARPAGAAPPPGAVPGGPPAAAQPARPVAPVAGPGVPVAGPVAPVAGPGVPVAGPGAPVAGPGAAPRAPGAPTGAAPMAGPGAAPRAPGAPAGAAPMAGPGAAPRPPGAPTGAAPTAGPGAARPPVAGPGARPAPPVVGAPAQAAPAASANTPGAEELPALRALAVTLKGQNHFQRLGLTEQTDGGAVKVAYFRMAKLYHPDTLPQGAPPELEKLKAEVFAYIGDAYRTLTDDKSRATYLEELKSGGGDGVDIQAILQAEELFQKSCILVKARKYPEAVKMLNDAIALNAEEPEFFAWRGYARFLASPDKKAAQPEAFREIQAAIKKNERMAPAHYFLGVIAKLCGDAGGALKHFKRTVELQPDHIDAMREVRMAAQKK